MKLVKLGDVCKLVGGGTPSKANSDFYVGEIPWATVRDLRSRWLEDTEHQINPIAVRESSTNVIPSGNVVLASRVGLGKVVQLKRDTAINQDLRALIPRDKSQIDSNYLYYWTLSIAPKIVAAGKGATVQGVTLPFLESLAIPLPSLEKQREIVEKLDSAFAEIDLSLARTRDLGSQTSNLLQSAIDQSFAEIVATHPLKKARDLVDIRDGTHDSPRYVPSGHPLITSKNLRNGELDFSKVSMISPEDYESINKRSKVDFGDLLFAMIGTIGNPVVVKEIPHFAIKNVALFKANSSYDLKSLSYYLQTSSIRERFEREAKGTTQRFLGLGYLRDLKIPDIAITHQKRIVAKLERLENDVRSMQSGVEYRLDLTEKLRQSFLSRAFSIAKEFEEVA